jgi:phage shock protein PspC (stress-responsive transcriptional regulator)
MDRTNRAAILAMVIVSGTVGGLGSFLGFDPIPSVATGLVLGVMAGLLLWGAARRAETFHPTDPNAHLADQGADDAQGSTPLTDSAADHQRPDDNDSGA